MAPSSATRWPLILWRRDVLFVAQQACWEFDKEESGRRTRYEKEISGLALIGLNVFVIGAAWPHIAGIVGRSRAQATSSSGMRPAFLKATTNYLFDWLRPIADKCNFSEQHPPMEWTTDLKPPVSEEKWTEDLLWQAARGAELGGTLCTCQGRYHALWGALRASGFLGSLHSEEPVIASTISPLINDRTRLLIGGSADPATLCAIGRISKSKRLDATIVDQCEAPLALISEFAATKNIACKTIQANLLEFDSNEKWDIIFLNYTLSFIDAPLRKKFFTRLASCLSAGGTLVCLAKTGVRAESGLRQDLESAWSGEALKALRNAKLDGYMERSELEETVRHYAAARTARRFNIISASEIEQLLLDVGLNSCSITPTHRKWVLNGVASVKSDAESSVIVTAKRDA